MEKVHFLEIGLRGADNFLIQFKFVSVEWLYQMWKAKEVAKSQSGIYDGVNVAT